jgi:hypothetical protein
MTTVLDNRLVRDYLRELDSAARVLPPAGCRESSAPGPGATLPAWAGVPLLAVLVLAPVAVAIRLMRSAERPPDPG